MNKVRIRNYEKRLDRLSRSKRDAQNQSCLQIPKPVSIAAFELPLLISAEFFCGSKTSNLLRAKGGYFRGY
jgi:hypothetical protein